MNLCRIEVVVLAVGSAGPTRVAFEFDRPLEDSVFCLLIWKDGGMRKATLPGVGQVMELERSS